MRCNRHSRWIYRRMDMVVRMKDLCFPRECISIFVRAAIHESVPPSRHGSTCSPFSSSSHQHIERSQFLEPRIAKTSSRMTSTGFPKMKNDLLLRAARGVLHRPSASPTNCDKLYLISRRKDRACSSLGYAPSRSLSSW